MRVSGIGFVPQSRWNEWSLSGGCHVQPWWPSVGEAGWRGGGVVGTLPRTRSALRTGPVVQITKLTQWLDLLGPSA